MKLQKTSIITTLAVFFAMLAPSLKAAVVTIPFTAPISSTTVGNDLADVVHGGVAATWAVQNSGSNYYQYTSGASNGSSTALWQSSNVTGATTTNWTETIVLKINDISSGANIGIFTLGSGNNSNGFLADVNSTSMRIIALGPNTSISTGTFTGTGLNIAGALGKTYTMTLAGTYAGSVLTLAYTLSDGTASTTISGTAAGLTLTSANNYFGVRNNWATAGDALGVQYQSIAIVPEPTTWALLAFSLTTVMALRRRRSGK